MRLNQMSLTRSRFPIAIACVVLLCSTICFAQNASTRPSVKTDRKVYPLPPAPELPKAGGAYVDPTFGTTIMRVTDESDGKENQNAYSYWPAFNRDSTMFFINCTGRAVLYHFDPNGFKLLGKEPLFAKKPPSGYEPRWDDSIWSDKDPNALFGHQGLNVWLYDVRRKQYSLVKDFSKELPPGHLYQMSKSLDDNVFGFSLQDPKWKLVGYLLWRRDTDKIILRQETTDLDEIQVDKSGKWCVVKTDKQGKGVVQDRIADLTTGKMEDLIDDAPDFAPGHSDNGAGFVIGADNWRNRLTFRKLATPHQFLSVWDNPKEDWSQDCHISLLADDANWMTLSYYVGNKLPSSGLFKNEIIQVRTDGSQQFRRLAHHRSVFKEYWDSPRACISRDGRFITYTSNWEGKGRRDVFILKVPPAP